MTSSTKLPRSWRPDLTRIPSVENGPVAPLTIEDHPQTANIWNRNVILKASIAGINVIRLGLFFGLVPIWIILRGDTVPLVQDEIRKEDERKNKQSKIADDERKPKRIDQAPSEHAGDDLEGMEVTPRKRHLPSSPRAGLAWLYRLSQPCPFGIWRNRLLHLRQWGHKKRRCKA